MSDYTKATNFATKDTLSPGSALKIVRGTEIDTEFNAISTAIATKADTAAPTFTTSIATPIVKSASTLKLQSNGTTDAVIIDTAQNVGVGVTPSAWESSQKAFQHTGGALSAGSTTELYLSQNVFYGGSPSVDRYVNSSAASSFGQSNGAFTWRTAASGTAGNAITFTQAMTLDASGNLLVGQTSHGYANSNSVEISPINGGYIIGNHASGSTSGQAYSLYGYNGTSIGSITQNGTTAVAYNTTSDYRLKENVVPIAGALAKVTALKPCTYTWKSAPDEIGEGFIAHELAEVCPQAVTGNKDAVDEDGNPKYQSIDTSFLIATLTAAIQEQQAIITSLTARIEALEA
jgi:hypothetical protein